MYKIIFLLIFMPLTALAQTFTQEPVKGMSHLRLLHISHYDRYGKPTVGELICNKSIAADLLDIFRELYKAKYRIERMETVDHYDGDDDRSMAANNTSCYNYRTMTGSTKRLSKHAQGLAIDINPLYNPYVAPSKTSNPSKTSKTSKTSDPSDPSKAIVKPESGRPYAFNRDKVTEPWQGAIIRRGDICHQLFIKHGFKWGGAWKSLKDYQHFEKDL